MGLRFQGQECGTCFFVTTTFKDWNEYGNIDGLYLAIARSLEFCCQKYDSRISGYVLMPSHIHLILFIEGDKLSNFMRDFKKYISQKAAKDLKINESSIWMPRYDRIVIYDEDTLRIKLDYIHNNPVKSGLAGNSLEWYWSSARDYMINKSGEIKIWKDWL